MQLSLSPTKVRTPYVSMLNWLMFRQSLCTTYQMRPSGLGRNCERCLHSVVHRVDTSVYIYDCSD